jgi:DNA-binding CsgD family transcriptional regulator/tetratricopeptide (TPR) repeat protein
MELLERREQLAALECWLKETRGGAGRLGHIAGDAGAGKSALVQRFTDLVAGDARILLGRCDPLTTPRPLGPLADVASRLGDGVVRALVSGARAGLFEQVLTSLADGGQPTVFVVEDAQWADEGTIDLLRFLGRHIEKLPVFIIVTYRDELSATHPLRVALGDVASSPAVRRIGVPPLTEVAITTLCEHSSLDAQSLYAATGGNAFFVTEVLAAGTMGVPESVSDAVLARAARLTAHGRRALEAAAVIGARIEPTLLLAIPGVDASAVDEIMSAGMLRFEPPAFTFRHELARRAVLESIPPQRRHALHAEILERLRAEDPGPHLLARLAEHAEAAGDAEAVLRYAPAAAEHARGLKSHREAEAQLRRALRFANAADARQRAELHDLHAVEAYVIDHVKDAIASCETAVTLWSELGERLREGDALRRVSRYHWMCSNNDGAERAARESLEVLEDLPAGPELAMAYAAQAQLGMLLDDAERTMLWGERAIALARETDCIPALVNALNSVGTHKLEGGDLTGEELLLECLRLARDANLEDEVARAYNNLSCAWSRLYGYERARRYIEEGITYCDDHDLYSAGLCARNTRAEFVFLEGQWEDADATAFAVLRQTNTSELNRFGPLILRARIAARRGIVESVCEALDEAQMLADGSRELAYLTPVAVARAEALWLSARRGEITRYVRPVLDQATALGNASAISELAFWLWRSGSLEAAPAGATGPYALQVNGDWCGAAESWRSMNLPYETAFALIDGDEPALREALAIFERLGAKPAAAEATRRLRALGARQVPRGPRRTTSQDAHRLTSREREVLEFIERDMSNAEIAHHLFLSERTVEHHVSTILAKLGVRTRAQAVNARRHQVPVAPK